MYHGVLAARAALGTLAIGREHVVASGVSGGRDDVRHGGLPDRGGDGVCGPFDASPASGCRNGSGGSVSKPRWSLVTSPGLTDSLLRGSGPIERGEWGYAFVKTAAFDVCGTLYDANTTFDFLDFHLQARSARHRFLRRCRQLLPLLLVNVMVQRLSGRDVLRALSTGSLKGHDVAVVGASARRYVAEVLPAKRIGPVFELVQRYRDRDYRIVLVSASYDCIIEAVADAVGADGWHSSSLAVRAGRLTGTYARDLLGAKHRHLADALTGADALAVITDDRSDLALLRRATEGVVVCHGAGARRFWTAHALPHVTRLDLP